MQEITPNVYEIDTEALGQEQIIASYFIRGKQKTAIVDPGFPSSAPIVKEKLKSCGFDPSNIDYVLLTHFHLDHSGGTGSIIKDSPRAKALIHKRSAFYVKNFAKIVGGARMVFDAGLMKRFGVALEVPAEKVISVGDGEVIDLGGVMVRVVHTPGHSPDSVSYFEESSAVLITGDAACIQYPALNRVPIPAGSPPLFDLSEEMSSLNRLKSLQPERILVPHYGLIESPCSELFDRSLEAIEVTKNRIKEMFKEGIEFPGMVERLRENFINESNRTPDEIPKFLAGIWLPAMIKTGLMGFIAYLLQYAPSPRNFAGAL